MPIRFSRVPQLFPNKSQRSPRTTALLGVVASVAWALVAAAGAGATESTPASCGAIGTSFGTAPTSGSVVGATETDCYELSGSPSDRYGIEVTATSQQARFAVRDEGGNLVCWLSWAGNCDFSGSVDWRISVFDQATGTFSYSLAVRRLNQPQGCSPLGEPAVWSFTAPRIDGSIDNPLEARCYTFSRGAGEEDGSYWLRALRTAGSLQPQWHVYGPSGDQECSGNHFEYQRCQLLASGQYAVVVDDTSDTATGSYLLSAKRINSPSGCGTVPSTAFGASPISGAISTGGEIDCHSISGAAGDRVRIGFQSSAPSVHRWVVVDAGGEPICYQWQEICLLSGSAPWRVLVSSSTTGPFSYSLAVRRLNQPQGCSPLGEPAVWSFTAPRIDGSIDNPLEARCYTFSRGAGEEDGSYWLRALRTAGSLQPQWHVYGPSGDQECSGNHFEYQRCQLLASGQYAVVVDDTSDTATGSYLLSAKRINSPSGCGTVPSTAFGASPISGAISTGGEIDCHSISGAAGDRVRIGFQSSAPSVHRWVVVDAGGEPICYQWQEICLLSGSAPWRVLVSSSTTGPFSYSLAVRRLNQPQGCSPLGEPAVWSFTAPRIDGSIDNPLEARCYTFSRGAGEEDGSYWLRALRTAGSLQPQWHVYGPSGDQECSGNHFEYQRCQLLASGQYAVVVDDTSDTATGSYLLSAKRINSPSGCASISSIAFGLPPVNGKLSAGGEIDCYALSASAGDQLAFSFSGAAERLLAVRPDGEAVCTGWSVPCTIPNDEQLIVLLYAATGTASGSYSFEASCENVPCGQSETAVVDAVPNRLGQSDLTTTLLRGRDLDLLESVVLTRSGQASIEGEIQAPATDGRAAEVRFPLAGAQLGAWSLEATFIDGTVRSLPGAVTVEAVRPAQMSVEMVGRDVFRPGTANSITLAVTNEGNVDGAGVPVVLGGIPENAKVEPAFPVQDPVGSPGSAHLEDGVFDQVEDTVVEEDGISLPLILSRVPAGRTIQLEYRVTVPTVTEYDMRAAVGLCLATEIAEPAGTSAALSAFAASSEPDPGVNCIGGIAKASIAAELAGAAIPGKACVSLVGNSARTSSSMPVAATASPGPAPSSPGPSGGLLRARLRADRQGPESRRQGAENRLGRQQGGRLRRHGGQCASAGDTSRLPQRGVVAIDPNDILGPVGSGSERFIPGDEPLDYKVLFENLPAASAPAQRVEIVDQLDTATYEPDSVLFQELSFGETAYTLPYEEHEIDHVIDLRPTQDLLVHATAEVSDGGKITVVLQAIDPETLAPPDDPLAGFLPPNVAPPPGRGSRLLQRRGEEPALRRGPRQWRQHPLRQQRPDPDPGLDQSDRQATSIGDRRGQRHRRSHHRERGLVRKR